MKTRTSMARSKARMRLARTIGCASWLRTLKLLLPLTLLSAAVFPARGSDTNILLTAWLNAQTNLQTWSADVLQIRSLKTLTEPLTATGHVWFAAPNRFRWQLGQNPPQTIAVRTTNDLFVIYPRLKRAERYSLSSAQGGQWRDALALLEAGFPRNRAQLDAQFDLVSQKILEKTCTLVLVPKSAAARKMIPRIQIAFDTEDLSLRATEIEIADGSSMRNEFRNPLLNPVLEATLFEPNLPPDFKVIEPTMKRR